MTKTQIWLAMFLGLFIFLFFLQNVLHNNKSPESPIKEEKIVTSRNTSEDSGELLLTKFGCVTCHGSNLKGTELAPTLFNVNKNYSREKLINYLRNPVSFMDSKRFQEFKKVYKTLMPAFNNKDVKELGKIADYLLKLK